MQLNLGNYTSVPDFIYGITREIWENFNLTRNKVTAEYPVTDEVSICKQILPHVASRHSA